MYERTDSLIKQKFKEYLLPTVLMTMALSLGVVVDAMIVSHFIGNDAFAAVNLCTPVILCYNAFCNLVSLGGSNYAGYLKGRKENDKADKVFTTSIILLFLLSAFFMAFGNIFLDSVAGILSNNNSAVNIGMLKTYMRVLFLGAPLFIIVQGFIPFIRTDGKPKLSSRIIIISNVVNLVFDFVFVGILKIGIAGAAISSVLGYFLGGFVIFVYLGSKERMLHFSKSLKLPQFFGNVASVLSYGAASALATGLMFFKNTIINRVILATLGGVGIVSFSVCSNCLTLAVMFIGGTVQTLLPIVSVLYGEEDNRGIGVALKTAVKFAFLACMSILVLFEVCPTLLCKVFSVTDPAIVSMAARAVRIYTVSLPMYTLTYIMLNFYQTTGKRILAIIITCCQNFAFIVPLIHLFSRIGNGSNIWYAFVVSEALAVLLVLVLAKGYSLSHKGIYKGVTLTRTCNCGNKFIELTIGNKIEETSDVAEKIMDFCAENGVASTVSHWTAIAAEEMAGNIVKYGYNQKKLEHIDINVKILEEPGAQTPLVILRLRDDGVFFNPALYKTEEFSGIEIVRKLVKSMEYSRVLGFNTTILKLRES